MSFFIGHDVEESGGDNRPAANLLSESLERLGFELIRLKTGTPPRLKASSCDFTKCIEQKGESPAPLFSLRSKHDLLVGRHDPIPPQEDTESSVGLRVPVPSQNPEKAECSTWNTGNLSETPFNPISAPQNPECSTWNNGLQGFKEGLKPESEQCSTWNIPNVSCWMTHTTPETHDIIRSHLADSALYGGPIKGTGVRYCPSIEDKLVRFADKERHQLFIEPVGGTTDEMYIQGFSTSLPVDVQLLFFCCFVFFNSRKRLPPKKLRNNFF